MKISVFESIVDGSHPFINEIRAFLRGETVEQGDLHNNTWETITRGESRWLSLSFDPRDYAYRIPKKIVNINGFEVEAPLERVPSDRSCTVYVPDIVAVYGMFRSYRCSVQNQKYLEEMLKRGCLFGTYAAAEAAAKAMLGIDPNT